MIQYCLVNNSHQVVDKISQNLIASLQQNDSILWLLSGGSNINLEVAIMEQIPADLTTKLTISLIDERYGRFNHPDSNFFQLIQANFQAKKAKLISILDSKNLSLEKTVENFEKKISLINQQSTTIVQIGLGLDGHIAGILPNSPAIKSPKTISAYNSQPFTRITFNLTTFKNFDQINLVALDNSKKTILKQLHQSSSKNIDNFPANYLNELNQVFVYNKWVGVNIS
jgi:6-phosphogluconolactonase/glucosamine-6-phosphate isomerase/deaminase